MIKRLSPVLVVPAVEPSLAFFTDTLGFATTATVPGPSGDAFQFAMLERDGVEVMLQTTASVAADTPALAGVGTAAALFLEVEDLGAFGLESGRHDVVVPRRQTFYGSTEIAVREPGGHVVTLAEFDAAAREGAGDGA